MAKTIKERRTERLVLRTTPSIKQFTVKYKGEISDEINLFLEKLQIKWTK